MPAANTKSGSVDMLALARSLAPAFPGYVLDESRDDMTPADPWNIAFRRAADGAAVFLNRGNGAKARRISVGGSWPRDGHSGMSPYQWGALPHGVETVAMTFDADRDPADLARDISRRFLAEYERLFTLCLEKKAERMAARADRTKQVEEMALLLGEGAHVRTTSEHPEHIDYNGAAGYGEISASEFRLRSVPYSLILELCAIVSTYKLEEEETT